MTALAPRTALVPHAGGDLLAQARAWGTLADDERRRRAADAAHRHDAALLWSLAEAYLTTHGASGATLSAHTRRSYRYGVGALLAAWTQENLLRPSRNAGPLWVRSLEARGLAPATLQVRLAAARTLYAALRWAGATEADPFRGTKPARDATAPWDKRKPYSPKEMDRLLAHARGDMEVLVLLCAHAGLRRSEALALRWRDVSLQTGELVVRRGKGNKQRRVPLSASLSAALESWRAASARREFVLPYRSETPAKRGLTHLCRAAGVPYRGIHALRHTCGTRLVAETNGNLEAAARHLGHASIETTRVYAKWSDETLRGTVGSW